MMWKKKRLALTDPYDDVSVLDERWLCSTGGGSGGGTTQSTQTVQQELSPEQQQLLSLVIPEARSFVRNPPELFPESAIAGFNPLQTQAQDIAVGAANTQLPALTNDTLAAQSFLTSPELLSPETNPALQANINAATQPIFQNLTENVLPSIRGAAQTSGQFGGSRQGIAEGIASRGASQAAGQVSAELADAAFQRGLQTQLGALSLAPQTAALPLAQPNVLSAVGGQQQSLEQALLSEEAQRFISEQILPFQAAQQVAGLAFGIGGGSATATSVQPGVAGPNRIASGIGGALAGGAGGALIGAQIGAVGGPAGAGIGAALGLLAGIL